MIAHYHCYFDYNYGTTKVPWDKLFGTFHDSVRKLETSNIIAERAFTMVIRISFIFESDGAQARLAGAAVGTDIAWMLCTGTGLAPRQRMISVAHTDAGGNDGR